MDDMVRQIAVPPAVRSLSTLARVDYADSFLLETDRVRERTAEQWARAVLEDAPATIRTRLLSGWSALGLRLDRSGSGDSVLGWGIRVSTPDVVLVGAESHIGMPGELLFRREPGALLFATFVRHGNPVARSVWARVVPVHLQTVGEVLEGAAQRWRTTVPTGTVAR